MKNRRKRLNTSQIDEIFADSDSEEELFDEQSDEHYSADLRESSAGEEDRIYDDYKSPILVPVVVQNNNRDDRGYDQGAVNVPDPGRVHPTDLGWTDVDVQPNAAVFTGTPGMQVQMLPDASPFDYFRLFVTDELIKILVRETNLYAEQFIRDTKVKDKSRVKNWKNLTEKEMWQFLALLFLTGIIKKPKLNMYWSTNAMFATPFFNTVMSRDRFLLICKFLHFNDNDTRPPNDNDRLYKVRPVYDYFVKKFKSIYIPTEHLSLDEGMLKWHDRLLFHVYNPQKTINYDMKSYILCEAESGYVYGYSINCGISRSNEQICDDLMSSLYQKNYKVYMGNFYNSLNVTTYLLSKQTHTCGMVKLNRGIPKSLRDQENQLCIGEVAFRRRGPIMFLLWRDQRVIKMISTLHDASMTESVNANGQLVQKPQCILDYNKYKPGVGHLDHMGKYYPYTRRTVKWPKKLVYYLIHLGVLNAHILFNKYHRGSEELLDFLTSVINAMIEYAKSLDDDDTVLSNADAVMTSPVPRCLSDPPTRLSPPLKRHTIIPIPATKKKKNAQRRCRVCAKKYIRKDTRYMCKECGVPLHIAEPNCFTIYHTKAVYWR